MRVVALRVVLRQALLLLLALCVTLLTLRLLAVLLLLVALLLLSLLLLLGRLLGLLLLLELELRALLGDGVGWRLSRANRTNAARSDVSVVRILWRIRAGGDLGLDNATSGRAASGSGAEIHRVLVVRRLVQSGRLRTELGRVPRANLRRPLAL